MPDNQKVVNLSPKGWSALADLSLLTDGNEGLTAYNTILSSIVATFRRKVAYLVIVGMNGYQRPD
ncbi:MAG: hypothetical protein LBC20_12875 [Planctomycetaceae bacterium]|nr:hypothetical protein [Planctomycetaceae bacterium]